MDYFDKWFSMMTIGMNVGFGLVIGVFQAVIVLKILYALVDWILPGTTEFKPGKSKKGSYVKLPFLPHAVKLVNTEFHQPSNSDQYSFYDSKSDQLIVISITRPTSSVKA
jgi:hypothetical protein